MAYQLKMDDFEEVFCEDQLSIPSKYTTILIGITGIILVVALWYAVSIYVDDNIIQNYVDIFGCILFLVPFFIFSSEITFNRSLLPRKIQFEKGFLYVYSGGTKIKLGNIKDVPMFVGSTIMDNLIGSRLLPQKCILIKIGFLRYIAVGIHKDSFQSWMDIINGVPVHLRQEKSVEKEENDVKSSH